jgi:hypothetical protein
MMPRARAAVPHSAYRLPTFSVGAPRHAGKSRHNRCHRQHPIDHHVLSRDYSTARPDHHPHAAGDLSLRARRAYASDAGARLQPHSASAKQHAASFNAASNRSRAERGEPALWSRTGHDWTRDESAAGLWAYARTYGAPYRAWQALRVSAVELLLGRASAASTTG